MSFDSDLAPAPIPEIVFIGKAFIHSRAELRRLYFVATDVNVVYYSLTDAVILTIDSKSMKVKVAPAEGDL